MPHSINLKDFIEKISYNKSQTYNKQEVLDEIAKIELVKVVSSLPTSNIRTNKIYLVLNNESIEHNRYDLYVYVNGEWEQIDSLEFNIGDYYTSDQINSLLNNKAEKNHGHENATTTLDGFMSFEDKVILDSIRPSTDNLPLIDSVTASIGESNKYSREDHVHPIIKETITSTATKPVSLDSYVNHGFYKISGVSTLNVDDDLKNKLTGYTYGLLEVKNYSLYTFVQFLYTLKKDNTTNVTEVSGIYYRTCYTNTYSKWEKLKPHEHGVINDDGSITNATSKNIVTDANGVIITEAKNNHSHGSVSSSGKITASITTDTVNNVVVTNSDNALKVTGKLPLDSVTHQDISGKINYTDVVDDLKSTDTDKPLSAKQGKWLKDNTVQTAGTGLSKTNNTLNHSNSVQAVTSESFKKIKYDTEGHITGSTNVVKSDITGFNLNTGDIKDTTSSNYTNLGSLPNNATQKDINGAINTQVGLKANASDVYKKTETLTSTEIATAIANGVSNIQLFEVKDTKPTSNIKGNKFYLIPNNTNTDNNLYDIYIYVNNKWEKIDSLELNIEDYYTSETVDNLLSYKVDTSDERLSDERTPTDDSVSTSKIQDSAVTLDKIDKTTVVDTKPTDNSDKLITSDAVYDGLNKKLDKAQTTHKGKNVVVGESDGNITFEDKNNHNHGNITKDGKITVNPTTISNNSYKNVITLPDGTVTITPLSHKSTSAIFGLGDATNYGHVRVDGEIGNPPSTENAVSSSAVKTYVDSKAETLSESISQISKVIDGDDEHTGLVEFMNSTLQFISTTEGFMSDYTEHKKDYLKKPLNIIEILTQASNGTFNLNNCEDSGFYYCDDTGTSSLINNQPRTDTSSRNKFLILVEKFKDSSNVENVKQTLTYTDTGDVFVRVKTPSNKWTTWVNMRIPLSTLIDASEGDARDLNTYTETGFYHCFDNTTRAGYVANTPLNKLATNETFDKTTYTGSDNKSFYLLVQKGHSANYLKQTLSYYDYGETYVRVRKGTTSWTSWRRVITHTDIKDNLTSTDTDNPLSANQGRLLNENKFDGLATKNSTNGSAIAEIKANNTVKGTIYHPKILSNAVTSGLYKIAVNTDGHITATSNVSGTDLPSHNQATTTITNSETYSNIGSNLTNQKLINDAINIKLASKLESVATGNINDGAVTTDKIANNTILNEDINPNTKIDFTKLNITKDNITGLGVHDYDISSIDTDFNLFLGTIIWSDNTDGIWKTKQTANITYENNIRTFTNPTPSDTGATAYLYSNNSQYYTGNWVCEFDMIETTSTSANGLRLYYGTTGPTKKFSDLGIVNGSHVMITCIDNVINFHIDNHKYNTPLTISDSVLIGFYVAKGSNSVSISNFVIYGV